MSKNADTKNLLGGIFAGVIVIWLGVSFYLGVSETITWWKWWAYFLLGLGGLFLLNTIVWIIVPVMRNAFLGMLIPGLIVSSIGWMGLMGTMKWWWIVIVAIGLVIIASTVWGVMSRRPKGIPAPPGPPKPPK